MVIPEREGRPENVPLWAWNAGDMYFPQALRDLLDCRYFTFYGADVNGWNLLHFLVGGIIYILGYGFWGANIIHAVWEYFQARIGIIDMKQRKYQLDTLLDTVFFNLGFFSFMFLTKGRKDISRVMNTL
jgi:hypothetical protein